MPSGMTPIQDVAITRGMNTVDDPKVLKPGECVRLLNAFPGNPPVPRNGCVGILMTSTEGYRFYPPGIPFYTNGAVYVIVWVYNTVTGLFKPLSIQVSNGDYSDLGTPDGAERSSNGSIYFDFIELHSCIYGIISQTLTSWLGAAVALGHKVFESNLIVRDMCIAEAGVVVGIATGPDGFFNNGKWVEYAFQYVRHTDSTYFETGTMPAGMIAPYGITSSEQPKRVDTFIPGACIGVELPANRKTKFTVSGGLTPTVGMMTNDGFGNYSEAQCIDLNPATKGFDADTGIPQGSTLTIDYTTPKLVDHFYLWMASAGSTNNFKLQCSSNGIDWIDASLPVVVSASGLNDLATLGSITTAYRYWRLYLNNAGADGPDVMEIYVFGKCSIAITLDATHATALAQGATHLRVYRTLEQDTEVLAQGATKFFVCDLPLDVTTTSFYDTTSNAALEGESNQLITGYSVAPPAAFMEYLKGRLFMMATDGRVYFSESVGGDGGTDLETAQAYPQAWASLFKPTTYLLDCDYVDGQQATGMKRLGDDLFMFKERKIFAVFGGDPTSTPLSQVSNTIGCSFPYTLTTCEVKGLFGMCLLFLSNDGPMVMENGGRIRPFSEFKIKELWPEKSGDLYSELETDRDWIVHNCTAEFYRNSWWIMYKTKAGVNKVFGYAFDYFGSEDQGPFEFEFAEV